MQTTWHHLLLRSLSSGNYWSTHCWSSSPEVCHEANFRLHAQYSSFPVSMHRTCWAWPFSITYRGWHGPTGGRRSLPNHMAERGKSNPSIPMKKCIEKHRIICKTHLANHWWIVLLQHLTCYEPLVPLDRQPSRVYCTPTHAIKVMRSVMHCHLGWRTLFWSVTKPTMPVWWEL